MYDTDNWPTHGAELARKALETLDGWMKKHDQGRISTRELFIITDAIYHTVSGLVGDDDIAVIAAVHEGIRDSAKR